MDIADTNIISTFVRVDSLSLVLALLRTERMYITAATYHELRKAVKVGCDFLKPTVESVVAGVPVDLVELSRQEILTTNSLPDSLGPGEAESIAVCLHRPNVGLLTNDKRAKNVCREHNIACRDLPGILRDLWVRGVATKTVVKELIVAMESEQGMVIKNRNAILEPIRQTRQKGTRGRRE